MKQHRNYHPNNNWENSPNLQSKKLVKQKKKLNATRSSISATLLGTFFPFSSNSQKHSNRTRPKTIITPPLRPRTTEKGKQTQLGLLVSQQRDRITRCSHKVSIFNDRKPPKKVRFSTDYGAPDQNIKQRKHDGLYSPLRRKANTEGGERSKETTKE